MNPWLEWGIPVITWLQGLGEWLTIPMKLFTFLGNEEFYLLLMPVLLWCYDVGLGLRVGLILLTGSGVNTILKTSFGLPRPYWLTYKVKALGKGVTFGFPSGHAQNSMAVWGRIAFETKRRWGYVLIGALIFLISISRLYLGVHFPTDVLVGWIVGALLLWIFLRVDKPIRRRLINMSIGGQIIFTLVACLILMGLGITAHVATADRVVPQEWFTNAAAALPPYPIEPRTLDDLITAVGTLFGIGTGSALLFSWGGFDPKGPWDKRLLRYVVGAIGIAALYLGLKLVFPSGDNLVAYCFRFVRYAATGFWGVYLAPRLFVALNLA